MIWLSIVVVALVAMAPLGVSVWRGGGLRSRREAALALHRAQLTELDRDLAEGRLLATEHEAARLEVQRRTRRWREDASGSSPTTAGSFSSPSPCGTAMILA